MTTPQAALVEALDALELAKMNGGAGLTRVELQEIADAIVSARAALAQAEAAQPVAPIIAARYRNSPTGRWTYTDHDIGSIEADGWREVTYLCDANAAPQPAEAAPTAKAARVHALVNAGPCPGMSEAFDAHMGAACWTDSAYRQDAATWAAAWKAALSAAEAAPKQEAVTAEERVKQLSAQMDASIARFSSADQSDLDPRLVQMAASALAAQPQQPAPEPAARVPLTKEQIAVAFGWKAGHGPLFSEIQAARTVERAHGITAPQNPADPAPSGLQALNVAIADALMCERERLCAAIKAEDDYTVTQGDYMLDSDDCISVIRGTWKRPDFSAAPQAPAGEKL